MTEPAPSVDETILALFGEGGLLSSAYLASALGIHERSVRRRLRRLIRDGYVFSPERGRYRTTAAGAAVMAPLEARPGLVESSPRDLIDRWWRRCE